MRVKLSINLLTLVVALLFQSCNSTSSDPYSGKWISDKDEWHIEITKVTKDMYDLKYFNPNSGATDEDVSGSYQVMEDHIYHLIPSKPAKYENRNGLTVPVAPPEPPKEVRFFLSEDGRLYVDNVFYTKQHQID